MRDIVKELEIPAPDDGRPAGWVLLERPAENIRRKSSEIFRRMLSFGYSPTLTRQLLDHMPASYDIDTGMKWIRTALQRNLPVIAPGRI